MVLLRGAGEGLPVSRWLTEVMWPREGKLTPDDVALAMTLGVAELLGNGGPGVESAEWIVRHLLEAEKTDRALRSVRYQMHAARFPLHRDLAGFEFEQSKVDRRQIEAFATLAFTEKAENIVLIGGTGTGKTHLATALGVEAVGRHGKRVRFYSTVELVNALEQEKAAGKAGRLANQLLGLDLVILDEPSSRLDPATERLMGRAVDRLLEGRTGIIIAHRLETVARADRILVMADGAIAEFGKRDELALDPSSRYHALLRMSRAGFEESLEERLTRWAE